MAISTYICRLEEDIIQNNIDNESTTDTFKGPKENPCCWQKTTYLKRGLMKGSVRQEKCEVLSGSYEFSSKINRLQSVHESGASHFSWAKMSKSSSKGRGERRNLSQCEWTHCCIGLIRRDKRGVNRFPSLGPLKSPLESMGHTPVRLSVYQPASLLPLQQDTGYSYNHPAQTRQLYHCSANTRGNAIDAMFEGKGRMIRKVGRGGLV